MSAPAGDPPGQGRTAGGGTAAEVLFDRYGKSMFHVARILLGDDGLAEDAVQDAFLGFVLAGPAAATVSDPRAYLFTALRNAAIKVRARTARRPTATAELDRIAAPESRQLASGRSAQLERALRDLPDGQREVVALKIDGGLTFAEIAACLGVSPNTAASRYRYALEKLRDALREAGHDS